MIGFMERAAFHCMRIGGVSGGILGYYFSSEREFSVPMTVFQTVLWTAGGASAGYITGFMSPVLPVLVPLVVVDGIKQFNRTNTLLRELEELDEL